MNFHIYKTRENKSQSVANAVAEKQGSGEPSFQFVDNRLGAVAQRKLQKMANAWTIATKTAQFQSKKYSEVVIQRVKTTSKVKSFATEEDLDVTYDSEDILSQGAEGTVHIGVLNGKKVIVKIAKDDGLMGMQNEIETFKNMKGGSNIVNAIGYSIDKRILILEKAETSLNRGMPKKVKSRMRLVAGTGRGLQTIHKQNFTHGDINLKNILMQGGEARLTDFGAATNFKDSDVVQKPIPQKLLWMIDAGIISEEELLAQSNVYKNPSMATDRKDFMKVAVNILLGDKENSELSTDKLNELDMQLSIKGIAKMSIKPIIELSKKADPTVEDLQRFLRTVELTIERLELQEKLEDVPYPSSVRKKHRQKHYKQKQREIQSAFSANKKELLSLMTQQ